MRHGVVLVALALFVVACAAAASQLGPQPVGLAPEPLPGATSTPAPIAAPAPLPTATATATATATPTPTQALRRMVVVLDPGHTPDTVGAVSADGLFAEHEFTLALALKLAPLLERRGFTVYLTRRAEGSLVLPLRDENGNGVLDDYEYLQPRTDLANLVSADVLVSLHFNGSRDPAHAGTSVYYASAGPYIADSMRLASMMQRWLVDGLRSSGYDVADLGALSDAGLKSYGTLYSLGQNPQFARLGRWPGVLIEPLFLTNAADAAFLRRADALDVLSQAIAQAVSEYLGVGCCRNTWAAE